MSSRALRRAQKERELANAIEENSDDAESETDAVRKPHASAFALLGAQDDDGVADDADDGDASHDDQNVNEETNGHDGSHPTPKSTTSRKKKKNKKKKQKSDGQASTNPASQDINDIDAVLQSLSTGNRSSQTDPNASLPPDFDAQCRILTVSPADLQVSNEIRRLFGRDAIETDRQMAAESRAQRQQNPRDGMSLADALSGYTFPGGPGLPRAIRERNLFVKGKHDWPKAPGGGLSMQLVERRPGGVVEYAFTHNEAYQIHQQEYAASVLSMDPMVMIHLARVNPYHVATLLQVSEIAKQQGDHTTAGDVLERALFSFGRAVHPSFAASLAGGKARLDFRRPENREFYLAAWRFIGNVSMRATWRTALEWARLLFALNPDEDPYEMKLVLDRFAMRAKRPQLLTDLALKTDFLGDWKTLPNIYFTLALAHALTPSKDAKASEPTLDQAITAFPYVATRLFQALDIPKTPPSIWGASPPDELATLYTELYATQSLDLWKPHAALLATHAAALPNPLPAPAAAPARTEISRSEARHIVLLDKPALLSLLPHTWTRQLDSTADPLPPPEQLTSYAPAPRSLAATARAMPDPAVLARDRPAAFVAELVAVRAALEDLVPGVAGRLDRGDGDGDGEAGPLELSDEDVARAVQRIGSARAPELVIRLLERLVACREALAQREGMRVEDGAHAAWIDEDGRMTIRSGDDGEGDDGVEGDEEDDA